MLLILALIAIVFLYFAFHAALYFSVLHFFAITNPAVQKTLLLSLVFLGSSFFIAMFLSHLRDGIFTRGYYFFAGAWIGLLTNLILFFALAWTVIAMFSWFGIVSQGKWIAIFAICAAIIYSTYGIWNAFNPVIKKINVSIDNLPKEWVGKKIVQISDAHLGHIYGAKYLQGVAEKINALQPDIIVITGDLFDGTDGDLDVFTKPLNALNSKKGIYYAIGNHETYLGTKEVMAVIGKTKIKTLRDQMHTIDNLQIIGIDYPQHLESKNVGSVIGNLDGFDPKKPSILLWHIPTQIDAAKNAGISLQLSGHTHKGQLFPLGIITSLVYRGYDYGYRKEGSFSIYTSSGLGGWGPPMRTENGSEIVEITLK